MTYYKIRVGVDAAGKPIKGVYDFGTELESEKSFHSTMATDMGAVQKILCLVVDEEGKVFHNKFWQREDEETKG